MTHFFKGLAAGFVKLSGTSSRRQPADRPQLEELEDRSVPTVVSYDALTHTLNILGDGKPNKVAITQTDSINQLKVVYDVGGGTATWIGASSSVSSIKINLGDSKDSLTYDLGSDFTRAKTITADLGRGDDTAAFNFGFNPVRHIRANLDVEVFGGDGTDFVNVDLGAVDGPTLLTPPATNFRFRTHLGIGNDSFNGYMWGDLNGRANVLFDVQGESGEDSLNFTAKYDQEHSSYGIDVGKQANLDVHLDGGSEKDAVYADYFGRLDGHLKIVLDGGTGDDWVFGEITMKAMSQGYLTAGVNGSTGADDLSLYVFDDSGGSAHITSAKLDGGLDFDVDTGNWTAGTVVAVNIP